LPPIIIIGGGISGLAAAFELAARRVAFVLLEASDRLGGLIRTEHAGGFTIEAGADSMLAQKPAALELCAELGLGPRLISTSPPRTAYVYARGELHPLPSPSLFGIPASIEGIQSYDLLPEAARAEMIQRVRMNESQPRPESTGDEDDESVADFFRRQFGPATVDLIAEPLLGGIHAGDVEQLSIAAVAPRLAAAAALHGSAMRGLSADASRPAGEGAFRSLRGGMGELVSAIEQRLPQESIRRSTPALSITRREDAWSLRTPAGILPARAVILAAPAHAAAQMLSESAPDLAGLFEEVPYVSTASVALAFPRAQVTHPLHGSGFVVARRHSALRITACTWVSSKWTGRAPVDTVLLRAFVGGALDPEAATLPDDDLVEIATRDMGEVLGAAGAPLLRRVNRWIRAGAQYNVGHDSRAARMDAHRRRTPGLFIVGSAFRTIGIPDCVADGRAAALAAVDYVKIDG
jgi:protoporphyrinogen/coproporphyrinogen III oxidase